MNKKKKVDCWFWFALIPNLIAAFLWAVVNQLPLTIFHISMIVLLVWINYDGITQK